MASYPNNAALGGGGNQMGPNMQMQPNPFHAAQNQPPQQPVGGQPNPFAIMPPAHRNPGRANFGGNPFMGGGGMGPQMGQASPGSFQNPLAGLGGLRGAMGRFGPMAGRVGGMMAGSMFGPLGSMAGGYLGGRFMSGGNNNPQMGPSPFSPSWLGGTAPNPDGNGPMGLGPYEQTPFSPQPGNRSPYGGGMTGMGSYGSRAGNVQGQMDPNAMGGFNEQNALQNQLGQQGAMAQQRAMRQMR